MRHAVKVARAAALGERRGVPDPKNVTEHTTLAELHEQRLLLGVTALHLRLDPLASGDVNASVRHATGVYHGRGKTEAVAIEAAFTELRRSLLPEALQPYLRENEDKETET